MQFRVLVGDITAWKADAIVNSANTTLLGMSGLDNRIHRTGGISLTAACRALKGCPTGEAKMTFGYKLPAKYVIHAVGPIWIGGKKNEERELASCYQKSLKLAEEKKLHHIAFTSIATEDKGYPLQKAAAVAIPVIMNSGIHLDRIDMVCQNESVQAAYTKAAVFFWLQHLNEADKQELAPMVEEAMIALVMLHIDDDAPDPIVLAEKVCNMKRTLRPFLDMSQPRSIIDIEQAAGIVMKTYEASALDETEELLQPEE
ncbi:MAG: macro domain-containing protein [Megasphaera sp.]|jgi:O-acetyl-ADP-ribose deacetylase (regulator of RNase III)|nr:macro domain-containing protein [Megasphaera sp.]MCH4188151.1 macro domain-containing protein [Megasphaera sp.]MCH4217989.1 macro domain-containing protein [Megasphaera sp.]